MSRVTFNEVATPATPATGKASVYVDSSDGRPKIIGDDVIVSRMANYDYGNNFIINGQFAIAQRQVLTTLTTFSNTSGRAYSADRWGGTNENASFQFQAVDTINTPETGLSSRFFGRFKKITSAGKMVISQVIEGSTGAPLRGFRVRFQCKMRFSVAASMTVRLGVLQLAAAGTVDTMPATFVSAFGAAGTDPTFGTNLALLTPVATESTGTIIGNAVTCVLTSGWVRYSATFDIPANAENIIPVIFTNGLPAANDELNIAEIGLYQGQEIRDWVPIDHARELVRCQRFYAKTFAQLTAPATNAGVTTGCLRCILGKAGAVALAAQFQWQYPRTMRATPTTLTTFNPGAANAAVRQISGTAGDLTATATANATDRSVDITATGIATGTVGDQCGIHVTADAEI